MSEKPRSGAGDRTPESGSAPGDLFARTVKLVSERVLQAAKDAGNGEGRMLDTVTGVVHSSVRGTVEARGSLVLGAKAVLVGVLRGTGEREAAAVKTITHTSRALIRYTAQMSGDLSASLKGLILGAIASSRDIGVDRAQAASAAAQGAVEGGEEGGSAAVDVIRRALREDIGGMHVALPGSSKD